MILRWFDTSEVNAFATSICEDYARLRKSTAVRMDNAEKRAQRFGKLRARVEEFHRTQGLNFYKKAKMINEIKLGLRSQNVPETEIDAFVNAVLLSPIG